MYLCSEIVFLSLSPRILCGELSIPARKFVLVKNWKSFPLLMHFCPRKRRRVSLCSWTCARIFLRIVCSSNSSKDSLWESCLRIEWNDLWSDRRFVCCCHVLELRGGVMMATNRGHYGPRFTRRIYCRWMNAPLRFVWDSIWFVRSFLSRSVGSMQWCRLKRRFIFAPCRIR